MKPPKLIHIRNGQRNFIRFSGKPRMIVEVWQFDTQEEIHKATADTEAEFEKLDIGFHFSPAYMDTYYLFVATQFPDGYDPDKASKIDDNIEYIEDWYLHQCLRKDL